MSFITHCPNCNTSFIIKQEQLTSQMGKVRCGQCQHVFNAVDFLKDVPSDENAELVSAIAHQHVTDPIDALAEDTLINAPLDNDNLSEDIASLVKESEPETADEKAAIPDFLQDIKPAASSESLSVDTTDSIFTMKRKRSHSLLFFFVLILSLLALAQCTYFLRQSIILKFPALKPYFVQMCDQLSCKIELPKNADLLIIDDSDLKEDQVYRNLMHLSSTILNNATYTQAYPFVELTLTDINDIPVLRRVFKPNEYLNPSVKIDEGIPAGEEIHITLNLTPSGEQVTGYRVFLTYDERMH